MGLIYNPSESQGLVSALNTNIRTATEMIGDLNSASKHLVDALNEKTLSGAAYTAGKGMFSQLILPTISKASQSLEHLKSEAQQYEGFASSAGGELLDEDKLNEQLQALQFQQAALTSQISFYNQQATLHPENSDLNTSYADFSKQLSSYMGTTADDIQKVQDKLKRLHEFDTNVSSLFTSSVQEFGSVMDMMFAFGLAEFDKAGKFILKVTNDEDLQRLKNMLGSYLDDTKKEVFNTVLEETLKDGINKNAEKAAKIASDTIRNNRYSIEMIDGKILGKTRGATAEAMKDAEELALKSGRNLGRCVSGGFAVVGGVMDGYADYNRDKDPGKAVAHGVLSAGGALTVAGAATFIPGPGWALAAGIVGGVAVSKGIDWLFEQKFVKDGFKDAEKNVGNAIKGVSNLFGSVGKAFSW